MKSSRIGMVLIAVFSLMLAAFLPACSQTIKGKGDINAPPAKTVDAGTIYGEGRITLGNLVSEDVTVPVGITHATATRTALAQAVKDTCSTNFKIVIRNSSNTALCTITSNTWGSVSNGVMSCDPASTAIGTSGTADNFIVTTSGDVTVFSGTVTATGGGGDITVSTVTFTATVNLDLTSFQYTASN